MVHTSRNSWKTLLILVLLLAPILGIGQGRFTVNGRLKIEGGDLGDARAVVFKDGVKERTITNGLSKFSLDLELNASYVVSFEKEGYVSKKISFNTNAPAEAIVSGFTPFDYAVSLFKQYDDINIVVFNQPVGVIRFDGKIGDFDYDTDYTKSIQSQLQDVLDQVEKKQKEEKNNDKDREAKEAAAAKAKAKADAEAEKLAAAKAKADEDAAKRVEAEAKALAEKEAEAKKAEEARKVLPPVVKELDPKPIIAEAPKPEPEKEKVVVHKPAESSGLMSKAVVQEDGRRAIEPVTQAEASPIAMARTVVQEETPVVVSVEEPDVYRNEELLVEPSRVTTVVTVMVGDRTDEYRKVVHKWGGLYYFKNGTTCTQEVYDREARIEELAGATPRRKMD